MFKLLLFSDLHADATAAHRLVEFAEAADVLIGAGDFGNGRRHIDLCIEVLKSSGKPAVFVAGNNETTEELVEACRDWPTARVLHGSAVTLYGVTFFGLGGGVPVTPFGSWSYDFTEDEAVKLLEPCPVGSVLVSHSPPKGAVDDINSRGMSLGSQAVRNSILRTRPSLVVCGPIQGSAGQRAMIGATPIINAGPGGVDWVVGSS